MKRLNNIFLSYFLSIFCLSSTCLAKEFITDKWQTANGTQVMFYQANEVPMLNVTIAFAAGSAYDEDKFGLSALTSRLLNQGNANLDSSQLAEQLAEIGAQYDSLTTQDLVAFNLTTLTEPEKLKKATNLFSLIINHPNFPQSSFNLAKQQQLVTIAQEQESPDEVARQAFFSALYQNHPYAHSVNGNKDTVATLKLEEIKDFYKRFFVGKNAYIVLVGDIDKQTAHKIADEVAHELPPGHAAKEIPLATVSEKDKKVSKSFSSSQTVIYLGQLGITHHDPDYFPLIVGNYSLGGGTLISRLPIAVREKNGLAYDVSSQFVPMPGIGPFIINLSTKNKQAPFALQLTKQTLADFVKNGPTDEEVVAAKQYLTGNFPLSLASNRSIANILLKIAFYHLPDNYLDTYIERINSVTAADIKRAFAQHIHTDQLEEVVIGTI